MGVEVSSQVDISYQEELWIWRNSGTPAAWSATQILGVETVAMPERTPDAVDVTHQQSPGRTREEIPGLMSSADMSQELQFWPDHASQIALMALADLTEAGTPESIRVTMVVGGIQRTYRAHVQAFIPTGTVGDKRMASCSIKIFNRISPEPELPETP
ncbi:hypothetical protein M3484_01965 [Pseudomonas sp. GX19020]|uniref:phage tail tube protein n=1 Tax=Pseudomonas sp. GX19020 TaxID=2942277 RepID=UPI0020184E4C|nr:phage tail tube protein [Pseudomonas sp. GX19020]MCL4065342.1 hypothetical protein [Pseudomonas sp. GX19020]